MYDHGRVRRDDRVRLAWETKADLYESLPSGADADLKVLRAGTRGTFVLGDNRAGLAAMAAEIGGRVTLAYLDPPFLTNKTFEAIEKGDHVPRSGPLKTRPKKFAFDDRWSGRSAYLEALGQRLVLVRELLAPHGSVVVHIDSKTSHYVKVLCDEIFGDDGFASEIIWRYRRWPSKTPNFQRVHDVLLRYRKDPKTAPRWNQPYEPLAASTVATWGTNKQRAVFEDDGRRARSSTTEEATKGVPMGDVWEIGVIAPVSRERTGYPSQKPETLLERLVLALSDPGEIVLDPYAGSGTTLAVAARLGRTFVGMDASATAFAIARARLEALGAPLRPEEEAARRTPPPRSERTVRVKRSA
jgi:DNA modification methylase